MTEQFSAALAVQLGGWDERSARVLAYYEHDGLSIAVIDTNGDGREVEADLYERAPNGRWRELASGIGSGSAEHAVWQCGYAPSRATVSVTYRDQAHEVPVVRETGMWYFAARRPANDASDDPERPQGPADEPRITRRRRPARRPDIGSSATRSPRP